LKQKAALAYGPAVEPLSDKGLETLSIEALSSSDGGYYLSTVIVVIVILLVCLALWSMLSQAFGGQSAISPRARNLFLGVRVTPIGSAFAKASAGDFVAHVLSLDLRTATIVSPKFFAKGDRVRLDLGAHPDYPDNPLTLEANVVSYRMMGGDPESFLVKVRFLPTAAAPRRELARYVESLGHHTGLSHA